jgi:D-serine deaminase-like pyridoxal phosphate-dependent protein
MAEACKRNRVKLRPHLKTAKSINVANLALEGQDGMIAVSTLREAEYFAENGIRDIQYAACITPDKLERVATIQSTGAKVILITDSIEVARTMAGKAGEIDALFHVQIEIDCGEKRSGINPDSDALIEIANILNDAPNIAFAGIMSHAGHSYNCRTLAEIEMVAENERHAAVSAAERVRALGIACDTVSVGSTPTALHARHLEGITETRPGVYMFGDMFQAQINSCTVDDLAVSVLTDVSCHRPDLQRMLIDAGALALSKDRSTENVPNDIGFGLVGNARGWKLEPQMRVSRVFQEHGVLELDADYALEDFPIGTRLRVFPNHVCMTAAMYDCYHVVDSDIGDGTEIVAVWPRVNGW